MTGISKSQVSRLCVEIDDKVKAFLTRPIVSRHREHGFQAIVSSDFRAS
ncbi:transposase-like protein [Bradyrhizobium sp. LM2.7]